MMVYLHPSGNFLSKEVLRGIAAWCCWRICWHCKRSGPCVGEPRDRGAPAAVGTRCQVVFLLKGVLYSQGVPSLSTLYSTMGMRYSSEQPLRRREDGEGNRVKMLQKRPSCIAGCILYDSTKTHSPLLQAILIFFHAFSCLAATVFTSELLTLLVSRGVAAEQKVYSGFIFSLKKKQHVAVGLIRVERVALPNYNNH